MKITILAILLMMLAYFFGVVRRSEIHSQDKRFFGSAPGESLSGRDSAHRAGM